MKNILIVVTIAFCFVQNVQAQINYSLNVKGSFGSSNVKNLEGKQQSSFSTGFGIESYIKLKEKSRSSFYINPSIEYNTLAYEGQILLGSNLDKVSVNYVTISAPILLVNETELFSKNGPRWFVGISPYLSFAMSGKYNTIQNSTNVPIKFGNAIADNRTSTDAGVRLKFGLNTNRIVFNIIKDIGLANNFPKDRITNGQYTTVRNFMFQISYRVFKGKAEKYLEYQQNRTK